LIVIEGCLVEPKDVRITALVFGMATLTHLVGSTVENLPMKAEAASDVIANLLMAIEAKPLLLVRLEHRMAGVAIVFQVRVTLDHGARHDDAFERCRLALQAASSPHDKNR